MADEFTNRHIEFGLSEGWTVSQNHCDVVLEGQQQAHTLRFASVEVADEVMDAIRYHRLVRSLHYSTMPGLLAKSYLR